MRFIITHKIHFQYSRPVFIEPAVIRLRPRSDNRQKLIEYELRVDPGPQCRTDGIDLEGTNVTFLNFAGEHRHLKLEANSETETLNRNPFDFIFPRESFSRLPIKYPEPWRHLLHFYQKSKHHGGGLKSYTQEILDGSGSKTLDFLIHLTERVHRDFKKVFRENGHPLGPEELIRSGEGACRDLTLFYLEVCRQVGLAGRYVSGYTRGDDHLLERELHAWAEIYLPGAGWRGFDPTLGLAVADHHVALSASPDADRTLPTEGSFRGTGVHSEIAYEVSLKIKK